MPLPAELADAIAAAIGATTHAPFRLELAQPAGGGCIHQAWIVSDGARRFFVKTNHANAADMFAAETNGLQALAATHCVCAPKVGARGTAAAHAFLVLEYLELCKLDRAGGVALGQALAELHRQSAVDCDAAYGWPRDNFIGSTPQSNQSHRTWAGFYADERLRPQLQLASGNGMARELRDRGEKLAERLAAFFVDYRPAPSLLHGDLWSGNAAQLPDGTPVIFDPAVYRGDRETDVALAELFGGFPDSFYAAYRAVWPLDSGYETRKTLYNLYHVLNHFNLFGAGYLGQAKRMIERLNAELRA